MAKSILFESFRSWKVCTVAGLKSFGWGLTRVISCFFIGIVSLIVWLWRCACRWVGKYPNVALGGFIVVAVLVWVLTFVSMRTRAVGAEHQRDSLAWQYQEFKTSHGYDE